MNTHLLCKYVRKRKGNVRGNVRKCTTMSSGRTPSYIKTLRALGVPKTRPIVVVTLSDNTKAIVVSIFRTLVVPKNGSKKY